MDVISLEQGKVKILDNAVMKKSIESEFEYLKLARQLSENFKDINIYNTNYKIKVPEVYQFKDGIITMERCFGENLEIMLRNFSSHKLGVNYTNTLFSYFVDNNFYWKDFAPRNILIDKNTIYIMDFERGIKNSYINFNDFLVDSVYEEYAAFLLPDERIISVDNVFNSKDKSLIKVDEISSKRVRTILNLRGYNEFVSISEYFSTVKMIILAEEPYKENNDIIYPLIELEEYLFQNGYINYANKIMEVSNGKCKKL